MTRCGGHSSGARPPRRQVPTSRRGAPTGRRAFPRRRARRTDLQSISNPIPLARQLHRGSCRNHRGRWPRLVAGESSGAPVQKPPEEIRMRSITTSLTTLLGKTGLLEGDFDYHLLCDSTVIIFLFFVYLN